MEHEDAAFRKWWFFFSKASLETICHRMVKEFDLPQFEYDSDDDEWGASIRNNVEVNVTRSLSLRAERLEELPHGYPDYNFVITFSVSKAHDLKDEPNWFLDENVISLSRRLVCVVGTEVYYLVTPRWAQCPPKFLRFGPQVMCPGDKR